MQNAAATSSTNMGSQTIEKVIEDARRALLDYDESFEEIETKKIKRTNMD
jgi:hypothetical protein